MIYQVEVERESDGRWLADVVEFPGVTTYGSTADEAFNAAEALALRVIAERIEHGEDVPGITASGCQPLDLHFARAA